MVGWRRGRCRCAGWPCRGARAEAQCSCTPAATPCPTCALSTRCCNCTNPCDYGGCASGYSEISADFCLFPPGAFAETCQRCTSVTNGSCASCPPGRWGSACQEYPGGATNPCNGNGACDDGIAGTGQCSCDPGFVAPDCQTVCGDVDGDDLALARAHLADPFAFPLTPAGESKCTVVGEAGPCDLLDVVVLARSLESPPLAPGRAPVCAAVTGP